MTADRLFDGTGSSALAPGGVLVDGPLILGIGHPDELVRSVVPQARLDYGDATILPGLVDAHMHLASPGDGSDGEAVGSADETTLLQRSAANAGAVLTSGVTTLRENGNKGTVALMVRDAIAAGEREGPTIVACGRPLTITGGHLWFFGSEADGIDGVRAETRRLIDEGADFIKIVATGGSTRGSNPRQASFSAAELRAICDEARRAGKLTAAHAVATAGIANALDAGVDMLIHCDFLEPDGSVAYRPDLVDRAVASGTWINPTLHVRNAVIQRQLLRADQGLLTRDEEEALPSLQARLEAVIASIERMLAAGARIVAGSDTPWRAAPPTGGLANEVEILARAGMTNSQALVAATSAAAEAIGVADRAGTLAAGKPADVTVVRGDALADVGMLHHVVDVFRAGVCVPGKPRP